MAQSPKKGRPAVRKGIVGGVLIAMLYALLQYAPPWIEILFRDSENKQDFLENRSVRINSPVIEGSGNNVEINVNHASDGSADGAGVRSSRK